MVFHSNTTYFTLTPSFFLSFFLSFIPFLSFSFLSRHLDSGRSSLLLPPSIVSLARMSLEVRHLSLF